MPVARAEDDALLFRAARVEQVVEQVLAHGQHAVGQQYPVLELVPHVHLVDLVPTQGLARGGVARVPGQDLLLGDACLVEIDAATLDLAGCQIAVLDGLCHVVLVHRPAEVAVVVRADCGIPHDFAAGAVVRRFRGQPQVLTGLYLPGRVDGRRLGLLLELLGQLAGRCG